MTLRCVKRNPPKFNKLTQKIKSARQLNKMIKNKLSLKDLVMYTKISL